MWPCIVCLRNKANYPCRCARPAKQVYKFLATLGEGRKDGSSYVRAPVSVTLSSSLAGGLFCASTSGLRLRSLDPICAEKVADINRQQDGCLNPKQ